MLILDKYSFFYDWANKLKENKKLPAHNFYFVGGRVSGKSLNVIGFCWLTMLTLESITWYFVRKQIHQKKEMMDTILGHQPDVDVKINYQNNTIKVNNNTIKVLGVLEDNIRRKQQKYGLAPTNNSIIMIVYEECHEFDQKDYYFVGAAIRSKNEVMRYNFFITNPISSEHPFIVGLEKDLQFNIQKLSSPPYYQHQIVGDKWIFYNNHLFIKDALTIDQIKNLQESALNMPWMKDMILFGVPGGVEASIFTKLMPLVNHTPFKDLKMSNWEYYGGLDFGYTHDLTVLMLWGVNEEQQVALLEELVIDPQKSFSTHDDDQLVSTTIIEWFKKYPDLNIKGLSIFADHDHTRVNSINDQLSRVNADVVMAYKKWPQQIRTSFWSKLISQNRLNICPPNTNFIKELKGLEVDSKSKKFNVAGPDHSLDAGHYAFCNLIEVL